MIYKGLLPLSVLTWFFLIGCNSTANTKDEATGRYVNKHEPGATHYVELLPDGKFLHHYKGAEGEFENWGKWDYDNSEGKVEISFDVWKSYGKWKDEGCLNGCLWFVRLKNNELVFNEDIPEESNFKKE